MTLKEYFDQDQYFSESSGKFLTIRDMPWTHAYYAYRKLQQSYGIDFYGTTLAKVFEGYLSPSTHHLRLLLRRHGVASCMYDVWGEMPVLDRKKARARLFNAARSERIKITTHDMQWDGGNWIKAEVVAGPQTTVRVKGERVA